MNSLVIIPCYNEAKNIRELIETLLIIDKSIDILIIDDGSPDRTDDVVKSRFAFHARVNIMCRLRKMVRGSAILDGFTWALEKGKYEKIVEMDADFSHDPKELPKLLEASKIADVVIGSRYLPNSRIIGCSTIRRLFSRFSNFYARILLKIPIHDYTSGYRVYSISAVKSLERKAISSRGYIVLSAIAYQLFKKGFLFIEVPIIFINRRRGKSNLKVVELIDAFTGILKIRFATKV